MGFPCTHDCAQFWNCCPITADHDQVMYSCRRRSISVSIRNKARPAWLEAMHAFNNWIRARIVNMWGPRSPVSTTTLPALGDEILIGFLSAALVLGCSATLSFISLHESIFDTDATHLWHWPSHPYLPPFQIRNAWLALLFFSSSSILYVVVVRIIVPNKIQLITE